MKNNEKFTLFEDEGSSFDFKKEFFKYFYYKKLFILSFIICFSYCYFKIKYTNEIYKSSSKILILDEDKSLIPSAENLFSSKINLEDEIEQLKSIPVLEETCENLKLYISVVAKGELEKTKIFNHPFEIVEKLRSTGAYELFLLEDSYQIKDLINKKTYAFKTSVKNLNHKDLPFKIKNIDVEKHKNLNYDSYIINFEKNSSVVRRLKTQVKISQVGKESRILQIEFFSNSTKFSEKLLDELVNVFKKQAVVERQQIHKRTIEFVNERFKTLAFELDSIEIKKEEFKTNKNFVDLRLSTEIEFEKNVKIESQLFEIEKQLLLSKQLVQSIDESKDNLIASELGLANAPINILINKYNELYLKKLRVMKYASSNNPILNESNQLLKEYKANLISSLKNFIKQLEISKKENEQTSFNNANKINILPEREKVLRSIERNQNIKESLYLYLLKVREESQVNFVVTEPNLKIIERGNSSPVPVYPKVTRLIIVACLIGLLGPVAILFVFFSLNTKIYSKDDINLALGDVPVIGEIPIIDTPKISVSEIKERTNLGESFRIVCSNLDFLIDNKQDCSVIISTSTIKGEGKTFCAFNLAVSKSSYDKKVLLIGADLRNPQLHRYLDVDKSTKGLTNIINNDLGLNKMLHNIEGAENLDILLSGPIPPNPSQLLNSNKFEDFINNNRSNYDYIIIDTPPSLVVSDTLSISKLSDVIVYIVRADYTEKSLLKFIKDKASEGKLNNLAIILNNVGSKGKYGYGYAYNYAYNYGYKYGYGYNYGYGYGYNDKSED